MRSEQINRVSSIGLVALSLTTLADVLIGVLYAALTGQVPPQQRDEGAAAHLFQLLLAALVVVGLLYVATADWTRPQQSVGRLVLPTATVVAAVGILLYFESYYR